MEGVFTISLDFELHWGVFDKRDRVERKTCYQNTLQLIPQMLELFQSSEVHVTWATVGSLFAENSKEWQRAKPVQQPDYISKKLSPYLWAEINGLQDEFKWAHFAPEQIKLIQQVRGQEIGTHTFGHYYCQEQFSGEDAFEADLKAAISIAERSGNKIQSLVFPRNQFNPYHLKICFQNGIRAVRTNPDNWFWTPIPDEDASLMRKVFRTGDAYFPMGKRKTYPITDVDVVAGEPLQLPASRLLRSWHPKNRILNKMALQRCINEMKYAARNKECYHLWWHPENFGDYPSENMQALQIILETYKQCNSKYGMISWNMGEYANQLLD